MMLHVNCIRMLAIRTLGADGIHFGLAMQPTLATFARRSARKLSKRLAKLTSKRSVKQRMSQANRGQRVNLGSLHP